MLGIRVFFGILAGILVFGVNMLGLIVPEAQISHPDNIEALLSAVVFAIFAVGRYE